ncbi:hypothetical protein IF2G_05619 [Cordyceps javanica]|nr:hypothetical protein IF2G_05619 [Cordyceps javanica]
MNKAEAKTQCLRYHRAVFQGRCYFQVEALSRWPGHPPPGLVGWLPKYILKRNGSWRYPAVLFLLRYSARESNVQKLLRRARSEPPAFPRWRNESRTRSSLGSDTHCYVAIHSILPSDVRRISWGGTRVYNPKPFGVCQGHYEICDERRDLNSSDSDWPTALIERCPPLLVRSDYWLSNGPRHGDAAAIYPDSVLI